MKKYINPSVLGWLLAASLVLFSIAQEPAPPGGSETIGVRLVWDHDGVNTSAYRVYASTVSEGGAFEVLAEFPVRVAGTPVEVQLPVGWNLWLVVTPVSPHGLESLPSEALVYAEAHTDAQRASVYDYLSRKWGISGVG